MEHKTIAIIPARKGSKRLPNKNLLPLGNIPLILHSINYAKQFPKIIFKIYVTTDDDEIKKIAIKNGVHVIDRPKEMATDISPIIDTLKHVVKFINYNIENVILLQPTNPLRPTSLLDEAFTKFNNGNFDSLITVTRSYQKFGKIVNHKFLPYNYKLGERSQDLEPLFYENGLLYIMKKKIILKTKIIGKNHIAFVVNHLFSMIDIDTQDDFDFAEFIYNKKR